MTLNDVLSHPLTHRVCKHTHDYGFYVTLAMFQREFLILCGAGFMVLVCVSYIQLRLGLEGDKE